MAKQNKVKPISTAAATVIAIIAFAVMIVFVVYITSSGNGDSSAGEYSFDQSFGAESSLEPPPEQIEIKETMADAAVGDAVIFGKYEQNGKADDGAEALEWIVLEKQDDKLLLISRYCIDTKPINSTRTDVAWTDSTLCTWLNGDFVNTVFSAEEAASIIEKDGIRVSMLSATDALNYYKYDSWRAATATEYAVANGARVENGYCWWWLTDKGTVANSSSYVHFDGTVQSKGFAVDYDAVALRPIIWVDSDAETETEHLSHPEMSSQAESDISE